MVACCQPAATSMGASQLAQLCQACFFGVQEAHACQPLPGLPIPPPPPYQALAGHCEATRHERTATKPELVTASGTANSLALDCALHAHAGETKCWLKNSHRTAKIGVNDSKLLTLHNR